MRGGVPLKRLTAGICAGAGISILSLSNFANAYDTRPFAQDEILLSTAALNSGQGRAALRYAEAALQREPENPTASRLLVAAVLLQSSNGDPLFSHEIEGVRRALTLSGEKTEVERIVIGLLLWQQGYRERAVDQWASAGDSLGQALAFRASGDRSMEIQPDPQMIELADRLLLAWEPNLN